MKVRETSNRGSAALGFISASILLVLALGGWYATWHHYHYGGPTPVCATGNLHLSVGTTEGTAGTSYTHVVVVNQGNFACTITGYPAVFLTDAGNNPIGSGAGLNTLSAVQTVTLAPGKAAHVVVGFPDHNNFSTPNACGSASANIELYPAGATSSLAAPLVQYNCPGFTTSAFAAGQ
ncbi:MAG TPA: DUF4232 domain-containing protein [Candidatus Saccharimonadales bacterium]